MIAAITLNSSIDRRYVVKNAQWGTVHHVKSCTSTAGGKGLNVARIIHALGKQIIARGSQEDSLALICVRCWLATV